MRESVLSVFLGCLNREAVIMLLSILLSPSLCHPFSAVYYWRFFLSLLSPPVSLYCLPHSSHWRHLKHVSGTLVPALTISSPYMRLDICSGLPFYLFTQRAVVYFENADRVCTVVAIPDKCANRTKRKQTQRCDGDWQLERLDAAFGGRGARGEQRLRLTHTDWGWNCKVRKCGRCGETAGWRRMLTAVWQAGRDSERWMSSKATFITRTSVPTFTRIMYSKWNTVAMYIQDFIKPSPARLGSAFTWTPASGYKKGSTSDSELHNLTDSHHIKNI